MATLKCLRENALKEIRGSGPVRCENRSLRDGDVSTSEGTAQETVSPSEFKTDSLRLFHDYIVGPIVDLLEGDDMENGEIALAPNPTRPSKVPKDVDFLLKMSDIQSVKLRAKLVVLSCCHSAQGKVSAEGVVGIARAFLGAGARSVVVSRWAIDDEATMEFMKCFYQYLSRGDSASVALNRAMKCLRESEKFGAVKYWAPFLLRS